MKRLRYGQAARDMAVAFAVFLAVAWGQPWRLLARGLLPPRVCDMRRSAKAT